MHGPLLIAYLYLGGVAAGAVFVMSLGSIGFRSRHHGLRTAEAFRTYQTMVLGAGFLLLVIGLVCLLWDLGSPTKALLVFARPHPTVITFGAYTLAVEAVLTLALLTGNLLGRPSFCGAPRTVLEVLACASSVATMGYTGVFLASSGVGLWGTWTIVALFLCSSLSGGISVALLCCWLSQRQETLLQTTKPLQSVHLACLALETAFLAAFLQHAALSPAAAEGWALICQPDMLATLGVGAGVMGLALPAALETYSLLYQGSRSIPASDAACLLGGLFLRIVVITCGIH